MGSKVIYNLVVYSVCSFVTMFFPELVSTVEFFLACSRFSVVEDERKKKEKKEKEGEKKRGTLLTSSVVFSRPLSFARFQLPRAWNRLIFFLYIFR